MQYVQIYTVATTERMIIMLKRTLAILVAMMLVFSAMVLPVMAEETTVEGAVSPITLTTKLTQETSPYAYLIEGESQGGTNNNMTSNQNKYKTFYVKVAESGDYELTMKSTSFGKAALDLYIDDIYMGVCDLDLLTDISKGYIQPIGTFGLSAGEHKIKVQCVSGNSYLSNLVFTKVGEQTLGAYKFNFKAKGGAATDASDSVYAYSAGEYDNIYANGFAQFELPENYFGGYYKLSLYSAANGTRGINVYLGGTLAESSTSSLGKQIASASHKYGETGEDTYSKFGIVDLGVVYLDGTNRYLTIAAGKQGDIRFEKVYLVPVTLNYDEKFRIYAQNITNPAGENNNGNVCANGAGGKTTLKFDGINVEQAGDYKLSVEVALNDTATPGSTMTFKIDDKEIKTVDITSTGWTTFVEEEFGVVNIPSRGVKNFAFKLNATSAVRVRNIVLERVGVGEYPTYVIDTNGNQEVIDHTATSGANAGKYNNFNADTVLPANRNVVYRVNVKEAGLYKIAASTATNSPNCRMKLYLNGNNLVSEKKVPGRTYFKFNNDVCWNIELEEGENVLRFEALGSDFRFNKVIISKVYDTSVVNSAGEEITTLGAMTDETITVTAPGDAGIEVIAVLYKDGAPVKVVSGEGSAVLEDVDIVSGDDVTLKIFYWNGMSPAVSEYVVR